MKCFVVDASVIAKWVFPDKINENHLSQALNLLRAIKYGVVKIRQPSHWLAEIAAVVVRLQPKMAVEAIDVLNAMDFPVINELEVYHIACQLSESLKHHLFDTLYHAVALYSKDTQLITADDSYYRKAAKIGAISRLADFSIY